MKTAATSIYSKEAVMKSSDTAAEAESYTVAGPAGSQKRNQFETFMKNNPFTN